jgi:aminopeptidase N
MTFDFIIIHEAAHEWFGNSITTADVADMWVHEAFANYAEGLYVECQSTKEKGAEYIRGNRNWIKNDAPIIPPYGINREGSSDMYPKGGNMLHMIRRMVNNDAKWRLLLRGLNATFRHQVVTGQQVQDYLIKNSGLDLKPIFTQYLTTTNPPTLEYKIHGKSLSYRWANVVPGFTMPIPIRITKTGYTIVRPTTSWKTVTLTLKKVDDFGIDPDFYVELRRTDAPPKGKRGK